MLLAVAVDVYFGIEPACVVQRTNFDERQSRPHSNIRKDR
jgi:hypothetical protein